MLRRGGDSNLVTNDPTQASQIGLAALGLCYSVEDANKLALVVTPGKVLVPDMRTIRTFSTVDAVVDSSSSGGQEYTANR